MKPNPYLYAALAAVYIIGIVSVMNMMMSLGNKGEDNIVLPMAMLSLFVLSAAVMGFLFVYQPVRLFLENRKEEAVTHFLKTVATFACFVAFFIATWVLVST